jgi:outer membrane protein assembly factor BamB
MAIITFAVLSTSLVRSEQTATSRSLGIKPQLERKDTYMLNLRYPVSGPYAWDIPHQNRSPTDADRCIKAAVSMVDSYFGGNLSQDRIAYHVYHEVLNYQSPRDDLGDPTAGVVDVSVTDLLRWALPGATVFRIQGKPDFAEIKYYIDSNVPIVRDDGSNNHFITVIDGYDTNGQMVYVIDPLTGNESKVPYDGLDVFVLWLATGDHITARSDEPTIWMDSDGDGVVDFDEINRFHTNPYNNDTYGLGMNDKTVIKHIYMDQLTFPTATFKCSAEAASINEQVTFDASESHGNITAYTWKFGDGNVTTVTKPTINHAYNKLGTYNVTLTVKDNNGLWNITTSSVTIRIQNVSDAAFYRQTPDRKGYAPTEGPKTPDLLWTSSLNGSVTTSPTVIDGKVFVGTSSGRFYALDMTTGQIIWTLNAGSPISSSPAFQDGVVFFGTENPGEIYAIDAHTGLLKWLYQVPSGAAVYSSPAVVDDRVIVGSSDGNLLCLNQWTGKVLWTVYLGGDDLTSPAIQNGTVFVTSDVGVQAVDMLTGTLIWEYTTSWPITSCPAVADGLVFVGSENNDHVYALDHSTGNLVWSFWTGGFLTPPAVDSSKQLVIVGSKDYRLYCLDEHTGSLKWAYINGPKYLTAPTISANGLVYVGTSDGNLCCVNETTGEEIWRYNVSTAMPSSPSIDYEHVFVGTLEGKIYCFGQRFPVHNITVSNLTVSESEVPQGYSVQINVTAENHGDSVETFNMTTYANGTAIDTKEITIMNGSSKNIAFTWNTTGVVIGTYTISAYAHPLPYETNTADNNLTGGTINIVSSPDVAVTNVEHSKDIVGQGFTMHVEATVKNIGPLTETFNVTAYANTTTIQTVTLTLASGSSKNLTFTWDTRGFAKGNYTISAYAHPLPYETDIENNNLTALGKIRVVMAGDADLDKVITIIDVVRVTGIYGAMKGRDKNYDPNMDWNDDGIINILDVVIVTGRYAQKDP